MTRVDPYIVALCPSCAQGTTHRCSTPGCACWNTGIDPRVLNLRREAQPMTDREFDAYFAAEEFRRGIRP